jgi:hypothetical protein
MLLNVGARLEDRDTGTKPEFEPAPERMTRFNRICLIFALNLQYSRYVMVESFVVSIFDFYNYKRTRQGKLAASEPAENAVWR